MELDRVDLDADDEILRYPLPTGVRYFKDDSQTTVERTAIFIGSLVRGWGQEMCEKVAVSAVSAPQLDAVVTHLFEKLGSMCKAIDDCVELILSRGVWFSEWYAMTSPSIVSVEVCALKRK